MKIAFVCPAIRLGGVDSVTLSLGENFKNIGHDITYVETAFVGEWSDMFKRIGHKVISSPLYPYKSTYRHAMSFINLLRQYDVVIYNDDCYARSIAGLLPYSTTIIPILHTDIIGQYITALGYLCDYDIVIAVSQAINNNLINDYGISPKKLFYIPSGVEVTSEYPLRHKNNQLLRILYLGRLSDFHKGIFKIPDIMNRIDKSFNVSLSIVGEGHDRQKLENIFSEYRLGSNISFLGPLYKEDVIKELLHHDVLLMPSNFEGFPIALLEAMASGVVPIVSKLIGSTDLVVNDNINGFIPEKDDLEGFANCIKLLAKNKDLLDRMSRKAWARINEEFSVDRMSQSYLKVINDYRDSLFEKFRSGDIDSKLLGDFPRLPSILVRPTRKILKIAGLWHK
jgi:glycosyltransferase involved in cell wall biosynthesis